MVCHNNRVEATVLLSLRGRCETWELQKPKYWVCGGKLFLIVFNQLSDEHS